MKGSKQKHYIKYTTQVSKYKENGPQSVFAKKNSVYFTNPIHISRE